MLILWTLRLHTAGYFSRSKKPVRSDNTGSIEYPPFSSAPGGWKFLDPWRQAGIYIYLLGLAGWAAFPDFFVRNVLEAGLFFLGIANLVFLSRSARFFVLFDLLPILAVLGMWVAPAILYTLEALGLELSPLRMPVEKNIYFNICIPATLALIVGAQTRLFPLKKTEQVLIDGACKALNGHPRLPWVFLMAGFSGWMIYPYLPVSIQFAGYLFQSLTWVALWQAIFLPSSLSRNVIISTGLVLLFIQAIQSTLFGELVFGLFAGLTLIQMGRRLPWSTLLVVQLVAVGSVFLLLSFKYDYRKKVVGVDSTLQRLHVFRQTLTEQLAAPVSIAAFDHVLSRLNQGSVTAGCFNHVPAKEPFAYGETIWKAFYGSFVPRLMWPEKPVAGGVENCRRFMGVTNLPYSINIGPIGEGYVNFGAKGAIMFLFIYGMLLRSFYDLFLRISGFYPLLFFFIPLIFIPALTIETDIAFVFNHLVKAGGFSLFLVWALDQGGLKNLSSTLNP